MSEAESNPTVAAVEAPPVNRADQYPGVRLRTKQVGDIVEVGVVSQVDGKIYVQPRRSILPPVPPKRKTDTEVLDVSVNAIPTGRVKPEFARVPICRTIPNNERYYTIDYIKLKNRLEALKPKPKSPAWVILKPKWWLKLTGSRVWKRAAKICNWAYSLFKRKPKIYTSAEKDLILAQAIGSQTTLGRQLSSQTTF